MRIRRRRWLANEANWWIIVVLLVIPINWWHPAALPEWENSNHNNNNNNGNNNSIQSNALGIFCVYRIQFNWNYIEMAATCRAAQGHRMSTVGRLVSSLHSRKEQTPNVIELSGPRKEWSLNFTSLQVSENNRRVIRSAARAQTSLKSNTTRFLSTWKWWRPGRRPAQDSINSHTHQWPLVSLLVSLIVDFQLASSSGSAPIELRTPKCKWFLLQIIIIIPEKKVLLFARTFGKRENSTSFLWASRRNNNYDFGPTSRGAAKLIELHKFNPIDRPSKRRKEKREKPKRETTDKETNTKRT